MIRVTDYFETQLRVPSIKRKDENAQTVSDVPIRLENGLHGDGFGIAGNSHKSMSEEQIVSWFGKVLNSVRLRSRKLQRYVRYASALSSETCVEFHFPPEY